jgi:hypothetical protein
MGLTTPTDPTGTDLVSAARDVGVPAYRLVLGSGLNG